MFDPLYVLMFYSKTDVFTTAVECVFFAVRQFCSHWFRGLISWRRWNKAPSDTGARGKYSSANIFSVFLTCRRLLLLYLSAICPLHNYISSAVWMDAYHEICNSVW